MVSYQQGSGAPYPLSAYGLLAASGDPIGFQASGAINGERWFNRLYVPAGTKITNVWVAIRTAGTWDTVNTGNQIGIATDAGVFVDALAEDPTLWSTAGWRGGPLPLGPIAAQSSARYVYLVWTIFGFGGGNPVVALPPSSADATSGYTATGLSGFDHRRSMYDTTKTMTGSFNPTTVGTATGSLTLVGVS